MITISIQYLSIISNIPSQIKYYGINNHYVVAQMTQNKVFVNVLTTKPYGIYHKISENCIDHRYKGPQYMMDQTFIIDRSIAVLNKNELSDIFFKLNEQSILKKLSLIDKSTAIDLVNFVATGNT